MTEAPYKPIIKGKGFLPNPVAVYGIPKYADSVSFPEVWGTLAWEDWWNEQVEFCLKGYTTGGIWIPGRYYYYLNFAQLSTVGRGYHSPDYVDADYEFAMLIEEAKRDKKGIIVLKRRRAGFSEKYANMVVGYDSRFTPEGYVAGVVAGLSDYAEELVNKIADSNAYLPPELYLHMTGTTDLGIYQTEKTANGWVKKGSNGKVKTRTANSNPNVMKGEKYNDVAFEEAGEFDLLIKTFGATKSCFAVGDQMVGTPYIYGTGGNVSKGSAGFREMWEKPQNFNLLRFRCFADRMRNGYYIGSTNINGDYEYNCPNLMKMMKEQNLSIEQILGCEDTLAVIESKRKVRADLLNSSTREPYYNELQNDPLNDNEAFLKFGSNHYPQDLIAAQEARILQNDLRYKCFEPRWVIDANTGAPKMPLEVELTQINPTDHFGSYVMILDGYHHRDVPGLFYGAVDGYDIDKTNTSKSQGGMVVMPRQNMGALAKAYQPVCIIYCRPPKKEIFYEMCAMMSVYWRLLGATMMDARSHRIIDWYKENNFSSYLAKRPQSIESEFSEQIHDFGYKETTFSKPLKISYIQSWCEDSIQDCWFPHVTSDVRDFSQEATYSDWDVHDALGMCLIGIKDRPRVINNHSDGPDPWSISSFDIPNGVTNPFGYVNQNGLTDNSSQNYDPWEISNY